jgi:hypothetical protein
MNQNDMMLQYLMSMGGLNQENEELAQRQAQIDALRSMRKVDTGMQRGGGMQVAASPWAHLANAVSDVQGDYQQRGLDAERKKLGAKRVDALKGMRDQMQQGQLPPQPGMRLDQQQYPADISGLY